MIVHFICRGNTYRSILAETYLNSIELDNIKAISSGTVARDHSEANKPFAKVVRTVLKENDLATYVKDGWDQLTTERLQMGDIVIFLNNNVKKECEKLFGLPKKFVVWDITDIDEATPMPTSEKDIYTAVQTTLLLVESDVDDLVKNILA